MRNDPLGGSDPGRGESTDGSARPRGDELAALRASDPVAVLPLAATEQHGPHLPLSTDLEIGLGILEEALGCLPEGFPVLVLSAQSCGASSEHMRFPGTVSLAAGTLATAIVQVGLALERQGVRRIVLANSHGGNVAAMEIAGLRLREEAEMLVVKASYFRGSPPSDVELPPSEWTLGLHGGAVETAMMMHLRPELVRADAVSDAPSLGADLDGAVAPQGPGAFSWLAGDLNPNGVVGDATLATTAMGERLVAYYGRGLADVIESAKAFPVERLRL